MSFVEDENVIREIVKSVLAEKRDFITFDDLRSIIEDVKNIYIDGVKLRKVVADMVREGIICKEPSAERRKLLFKLCIK